MTDSTITYVVQAMPIKDQLKQAAFGIGLAFATYGIIVGGMKVGDKIEQALANRKAKKALKATN